MLKRSMLLGAAGRSDVARWRLRAGECPDPHRHGRAADRSSTPRSGTQMKHGAEQAVADMNKAGGVLGKQLVLDVGDDACDPKQAVSVANQLASKGREAGGRSLLLRQFDPGQQGVCRGRDPADFARID